jgi:hypothetical protein
VGFIKYLKTYSKDTTLVFIGEIHREAGVFLRWPSPTLGKASASTPAENTYFDVDF